MERLNKEWYEVTFDGDLSQIAVGDLITRTCYPEVLIRNCRMGNNRARGLLLGSRKKTVVEGCYFHTPGAAILFEGDGYYWYEQAGVRDVEIRNCVFDNCLYGAATWGDAIIATGNGPKHDRERSRYHRNHSGRGQHLPRVRPAYRQPLLCRRVRVHAGQCNRIYR